MYLSRHTRDKCDLRDVAGSILPGGRWVVHNVSDLDMEVMGFLLLPLVVEQALCGSLRMMGRPLSIQLVIRTEARSLDRARVSSGSSRVCAGC